MNPEASYENDLKDAKEMWAELKARTGIDPNEIDKEVKITEIEGAVGEAELMVKYGEILGALAEQYGDEITMHMTLAELTKFLKNRMEIVKKNIQHAN